MADLMLPSAVLTHLKAGVRTPAAPEPVLITVWVQPAFVTEAKHANPSLTTAQSGARLRSAKSSIAAPENPATRRSFKRTGLPSSVVSTAATNGVLPAARGPVSRRGARHRHRRHRFLSARTASWPRHVRA